MKKILCAAMFIVVCFCGVYAWAEVAINATNFPDSTFRDIVSSICDTNLDGVLDDSEISRTHTLQLDEKGITSLKGIEYFTALNIPECYDNQLTALNVSKNKRLRELFCNSNYQHRRFIVPISAQFRKICAFQQTCECLERSRNRR